MTNADGKTWVTDSNGNRCSVQRFGSQEAAQKALDSLKDCSNCSDCSDCSRCSDCSDCSDCSRCSDCSDCSGVEPPNAERMPEVPAIPDIHKAVYAAACGVGALEMDNWHTCETTHCRAGWVVHLAGEKGRALEKRFDTLLAAMKIYDASDPNFRINPCRFYDTNADALEDMRRLAEAM